MIATYLGLGLVGSLILLIMMSDFTNSGLRIFGYTTLFVGWSAWIGLGVLVERKFKIIIFRRSMFYYHDEFYRRRIRPNLLKVIARKRGSSANEIKNKEKF